MSAHHPGRRARLPVAEALEPSPRKSRHGDAADPLAISDRDVALIAQRVHQLTGIVLPSNKRPLVIRRVRKRLQALALDNFASYLAYLEGPDGDTEDRALCNVMTTNMTAFFREPHHFEDLARELGQPTPSHQTGATLDTGSQRLRIWSAGCSTGEEAYSIAFTALRANPAAFASGLRILATDIDTEALNHARAATFSAEQAVTCPPQYRTGNLEPGPEAQAQVCARARALVTFNRLNLHDSWPVTGPFDAIFCRNVLIYFDVEAKHTIIERLTRLLRPGGTLYLGHSESSLGSHPQLENQGRTIFRKRQ